MRKIKQEDTEKSNSCRTNDFEIILRSKTPDGTEVLSSSTNISDIAELWKRQAISEYDPNNRKYSTYLKESNSISDLTDDTIDTLTDNPQNDISKVIQINQITRRLINKNDIIGKTSECITSNVNTSVKYNYSHIPNENQRNKKKQFAAVQSFIHDFNDQIMAKQVVRNAISTTYNEGNWIAYLRHDDINNYVIDVYPLKICEISDYEVNGRPVVLFNIQELKSRLQKTYKKTRKNKALFFDKIDEEVKSNFPDEVYKAFKDGESYAILDPNYTGVIRINNFNRPYGVTPVLRAFSDIAMLDTFAASDKINSKAKAKKIIWQQLRKEAALSSNGDYNKKYFDEMAYSHQNFMNAFQQDTVVITSTPFVENISYVEPKTELTDTKTINTYRSKVLSTLGISFLMDTSSQSVSTASISIEQLMRVINTISEQLEDILEQWIRQLLLDNNLPVEYAPDVQVIDSEALSFDLRKELATTLYTMFNGSLSTSLDILGIDVNDEKQKRINENEEKYDTDIFYPRATSYTSSGNETEYDTKYQNKGGRPQTNNNKDKQAYDQVRNDEIKDKTGG